MVAHMPRDGTPRQRIEWACDAWGREAVISGCVDLIEGRDADPDLVFLLGGGPASWALGGNGPPGPSYWLRVWGARGLLWAWDDSATPALIAALGDESWRVREMAAKVAARHRVDAALDAVAELQQDSVARVRRSADRAVRALVQE